MVDAGRRAGYRIFIGGDINAKVGGGDYTSNHAAAGPYGFGEQNARGQWLIGWSSSTSMKIGNKIFQKQDEQLVTHIGTQGQWSQLDYFLVDKWFRSRWGNIESGNFIDLGSDHKALKGVLDCSVKSVRKHGIRKHKGRAVRQDI